MGDKKSLTPEELYELQTQVYVTILLRKISQQARDTIRNMQEKK